MTKKLFLLMAIVLISQLVQAQKIHYLIRAGINGTNGYFSEAGQKGSASFLPGAYVGLQLKAGFEPPLYFTPQINLLHKATEFTLNNGTDTAKLRLELNQIQIAPFLQYDFHKDGQAGFFINGSLSLYTSISGKSTVTHKDGSKTKTNMRFSKTAYGTFEAGAHLGVGYEWNKLALQLMYHQGLSNMFNGDNSVYSTGPKIRFNSLSLGIGWYLN